MRQFVLPPDYDGSGSLRISGGDAKYILKVLRLKEGDAFPAVDRTGKRFRLQISQTGGGFFTASVQPSEAGAPPDTQTVLLQCLPKGKKLELIVRQSVEAGISMIIPVESAHSIARINNEREGKKTDRLSKIAEEAAQQSGNRGVPEITHPVTISKLPALLSEKGISGLKLFFHQERLEKGSLHGYLKGDCNSVCLLIGPEGGLSADETDFLLASGFYPVYLGENVLRTETAVIYALGAVNTILMEKNEWKTDIRE